MLCRVFTAFVVFLVCTVFMPGCAVERGVRPENLFYSSAQPNIQIRVEPKLNFKGKMECSGTKTAPDVSAFIHYTIYPFVEATSSDLIQRMFLVSFLEIRGMGPKFIDVYKNRIEINDKYYNFYAGAAGSDSLFEKEIRERLQREGLVLANWYVGGVWYRYTNEKLRLRLHYVESLTDSADNYRWSTPEKWTSSQKSLLKEVLERGRQAFQILN